MPVPIPCLGYPSRTAAARALSEQGLKPNEIGARIGVTGKQASCFLYYAANKRAKRPYDRRTYNVRISRDVIDDLVPHATRRGVHVHELTRLILAAVSDDEMVDAVLDDAD
jgi:predicted transcriptional regulator